MIYTFLRGIFRIFFKLLFFLRASGTNHIPKDGAVIICCNHKSYWDPPIMGTPLERKVSYMAKAELFRIPVFGWVIRQTGAFPVRRGGVSKDSIRGALRILENGGMLGIFPEGTRARENAVTAKRGAANLAFKSGATVVPAAIIGSYKPFRPIHIVYGSPVDLSEFADDHSSEAQERATDKIMSAIRGLMAEHE